MTIGSGIAVAMRKIDQWLIAKVQDAYLWAFDWTGVRVGMVIFMLAGTSNFLWWLKYGEWIAVFFIGTMGIIGVALSWMQDHNQTCFNMIALHQETSWFRKGFTVFVLCFFLLYLFSLDWRGIISEMCWLGYCYMICVKVRDREPKEFKFFKLAMAGAS